MGLGHREVTEENVIDLFFDFAIVCQSSRQAMNRRSKELLAGPNSNFRRITARWSCDVCMLTNQETEIKCKACETPKPGAKIEEAGLGA